MKINFKDWFEDKPEEVMLGVELELFLFDVNTKEPMRDNDYLEDILQDLPYNIYKDYYPHQLELRTDAFNNPEDLIRQTKELYNLAANRLNKHGIIIIPAPNITVDDRYMWCGMHIHISYPNRKQTAPYWNKAMGMYPFILSLTDHTKNFEVNQLHAGERVAKSRHIGLPYFDKSQFLRGNSGERKYKDIILSNEVSDDGHGRHRLIKPATIEMRIFDTPSLVSTYETMIRYIFSIAQYIKNNNPMVTMIENQRNDAEQFLFHTRGYITTQRYGVNKIFHKLNTDVCEEVCDFFNISFNRETQFEFREKLGLQANVNGYLSMAIEGGWL